MSSRRREGGSGGERTQRSLGSVNLLPLQRVGASLEQRGLSRIGLAAAALAILVLISRLPFHSRMLWAWDSVLYARALENGFHVDFALSGQRPHPPGYILYVATAALAKGGLADSNSALFIVSAAGAALAAVGVFLLARRFASGPCAFAAACAFAASPLVWLYSEVAYPYTVLACASVFLATAFWSARTAGAPGAIFASALFGVASGFRQDLLLLLTPLWIWAVWPQRVAVRAVAGVALCGGVLVWLAPTIALSDGLEEYARALLQQADSIRVLYSSAENGYPALLTNLGTTTYAIAWGLALATVPLVLAAALWLRPRRRISRRAVFLTLWGAPGLLFYVAVHIGEWGYVLSIIPEAFVLVAIALDALRLHARPRLAHAVGWVVVVAAGALFLLGPGPFSAQAIAAHDDAFAARVRFVRENYSPRSTGVLAREDYLLVRHYLAEYRVMFHDPDPYARASRHMRTREITAFVVFTSGLSAGSDVEVRYVACARGVNLAYVRIPAGAVLVFNGERFGVRSPE